LRIVENPDMFLKFIHSIKYRRFIQLNSVIVAITCFKKILWKECWVRIPSKLNFITLVIVLHTLQRALWWRILS